MMMMMTTAVLIVLLIVNVNSALYKCSLFTLPCLSVTLVCTYERFSVPKANWYAIVMWNIK